MNNGDTNKLYQNISRIHRGMHRMSHQEGAGIEGMHPGQGFILLRIARLDGASQKDLAEKMDMRAPSMTEQLVKLEEKGLIERRKDKDDQRITRVFVTEKCKKIVEEIEKKRGELSGEIFSPLSEEEQAQLLELTNKLIAGMKDMDIPEHSHHRKGHGHGGCGRSHGEGCHGHHHKKDRQEETENE